MSLTVVSFGAAVRVGGEHDGDGVRGFVLLACEPTPCLLTRRAAREVARALVRFAERVRPARQKEADAANRARSEAAKEQHKTSNPRKGEKSGGGSREPRPKGTGSHAASALAAATHTSRATAEREKDVSPLT